LRPSPMDGPKGSNLIRLWGRANETRFLKWLIGEARKRSGGVGWVLRLWKAVPRVDVVID
jgi:hypothetical protein